MTMRPIISTTLISLFSLTLTTMTTTTTTTTAMTMVRAWSQSSAFMGGSSIPSFHANSFGSSASLIMYDNSRDPPNDHRHRHGQNKPNAWTVLSTTEQWISDTLHKSNANVPAGGANNPYSRKEVSYVCEASSDPAMIVANLFRRLKEARELGEKHGESELERAKQMGSKYEPHTLRQTQVLVIPSNNDFHNSFIKFNNMIETVNHARRQARDYVTEAHWDRMDSYEDEDEENEEWSVTVNCAHLHPKFGQKTPAQELEDLRRQDEEGEVDVHYEEYKNRKLLARQSPYPTVVIEVRATPPPDFSVASPPARSNAANSKSASSEGVTAADILKLEQLFAQQAHMNHPTKHTTAKQEEEAFYSAIGKQVGNEELSIMTPLAMAQSYLAVTDPTIHGSSVVAAFTESSTTAVDEAFEFVFTNVAMMMETIATAQGKDDVRHYVVLPRFVTSAATSLEKFAEQCSKIMATLALPHSVQISTYHPEHVHENMRSPMPILHLQWQRPEKSES